jgi:RsiW-degrading membrane proteinase PrsW (M82 family)
VELSFSVKIIWCISNTDFFCNYIFSWIGLGFFTDVDGKIPVKVVLKTFASGKIYMAISLMVLMVQRKPNTELENCNISNFFRKN